MTAIFAALLSFLFTPIGVIVGIIMAVLLGKFAWHVVVALAETALIVAILGVVIYALGGFDGAIYQRAVQAPNPVVLRHARRI